MNLKSQLAPKGLQFNPSDFNISDKYATILTVISYPRFIGPGYLSSLTNMSGVKVVIKHMPLPFSVLAKMLNKEIADLKQKYQDEHDKTIQERIRQDVDSLEYFIQQFTAAQTRTFDFQMHIMITADTREDLEIKKLTLKNYLDAMELRAIPLKFEQESVLKSILPIFDAQPIEMRIGTPMPSPTMAAMYPFIFDSIKDTGLSTLLGVDFSGGVILFNQFLYQLKKENNRNNANMIILGTSGSGKSTAAKLLLRSHIRNGYQIVAIDPEGEITEMTKMYGGEVVYFSGDYTKEIDIEELEKFLQKENDFKYLNKETIQYIVETNELAGNMIFDMNLSEIENLINKGFEIPTAIYQDARFIKKIIGIADVIKYRFFMEDFSDKHNPLYIEEKRDEYYDNLNTLFAFS